MAGVRSYGFVIHQPSDLAGAHNLRWIMKKICKVEECNRSVDAWGYCPRHYMQMRKRGYIFKRTRFDSNKFIVENGIVRIILYTHDGELCGEALIDPEWAHLDRLLENEYVKKIEIT